MKRYWHFLPDDKRLRYGDGRLITTASVVTVPKDRPLDLCYYGLHASWQAIDALQWAPGPIVCRVTLHGDIITDDDKAAAYERRVAWMADATETLRDFAYWCADRAVRIHAVKALRAAGLKDEACKLESLDPIVDAASARDAEYAAGATRYAARAAAWSTRYAAGDAAGDAARYAAGDAEYAARYAAWSARYAAEYAARYAARYAAGDAEYAGSRKAERNTQNRHLTRALFALGGSHE